MAFQRKSVYWTESRGWVLSPILFMLLLSIIMFFVEPTSLAIKRELKRVQELNKDAIEAVVGRQRNADYSKNDFFDLSDAGSGNCLVIIEGTKGSVELIVSCKCVKRDWWIATKAYMRQNASKKQGKIELKIR